MLALTLLARLRKSWRKQKRVHHRIRLIHHRTHLRHSPKTSKARLSHSSDWSSHSRHLALSSISSYFLSKVFSNWLRIIDIHSTLHHFLGLFEHILIYIDRQLLNIIFKRLGFSNTYFIIGLFFIILWTIGFYFISWLKVSGSSSILSSIPCIWGSYIIYSILSGSTALDIALIYCGWLIISYPPTPKGEDAPNPVLIPAPGTIWSFEATTYITNELTFLGYFLAVLMTTITVPPLSFAFSAVSFQASTLPLKTNLNLSLASS